MNCLLSNVFPYISTTKTFQSVVIVLQEFLFGILQIFSKEFKVAEPAELITNDPRLLQLSLLVELYLNQWVLISVSPESTLESKGIS